MERGLEMATWSGIGKRRLRKIKETIDEEEQTFKEFLQFDQRQREFPL